MNQEVRGSGIDTQLKEKTGKLKQLLSGMSDAVVGFSGGIDSTFLAKVASDVISGDVIAVTIDSELFPEEHIKLCERAACEIGVEHVVLTCDLLSDKNINLNSPERCYYCKKEIFSAVSHYAHSRGIRPVLEGMNADDLLDYRPGRKALGELGVMSPLCESGFTKVEIRAAARRLGLSNFDQPATPCLATRIPSGTIIEKTVLERIGKAEAFLNKAGFEDVRVRVHGDLARIELSGDDKRKVFEDDINFIVANKFKELGFEYICIDMEGYRMGSMNMKVDTED